MYLLRQTDITICYMNYVILCCTLTTFSGISDIYDVSVVGDWVSIPLQIFPLLF